MAAPFPKLTLVSVRSYLSPLTLAIHLFQAEEPACGDEY